MKFDMPFWEQIKYFESKGIKMTPEGYKQLWAEANARAFTVAKVTNAEILQDIKDAVEEAMLNGESLQTFREQLSDYLTTKGWFAPKGEKATVVMPDGTIRKRLTGWRLDTILGTNSHAAYQVGRYKQMMEHVEDRPYWRYNAIDDPRVRPSHFAQDGKIYPYDDPFWDKWYPPNGYNCRCYVTTLSERQVRPDQIEQTQPVESPDKGFEYNVGKEGLDSWKPDLSKLDPELRKYVGD